MKYNNQPSKKYKSKLEHYCAKKLTEAQIPFEYESVTYTLVPSFHYTNVSYETYTKKRKKVYEQQRPFVRPVTYTPDFIGDGWIIETKGYETSDFKIKWKMFKLMLLNTNSKIKIYKPTSPKQIDETISLILKTTNHVGYKNKRSRNKRARAS